MSNQEIPEAEQLLEAIEEGRATASSNRAYLKAFARLAAERGNLDLACRLEQARDPLPPPGLLTVPL